MIRLTLILVTGAMATLAWPCWCASGGCHGLAEGQAMAACQTFIAARLHQTATPEAEPADEPGRALTEGPQRLLAEPALGSEVAPPSELPRRLRWRRMEVHYLQANVRHPALYYDSPQEKLKHDDAAFDNLPGAAAAVFYEIVQFPIQLAATPVLWVLKPPWTFESTEP